MMKMFRDAYERACKFTFPVIQFVLTVEGKCSAGAAAFIIINPDGWIITAAHVMKDSIALAQSDHAARDWESRRDAIRNDASLSAKERSRRISALGQLQKKGARRGTSVWALGVGRIVDVTILEEADLAVARLDGFDRNLVSEYPTFKDPSKNFRPGASLCKLGYPFTEFTPTYDETANRFDLPPDQAQIAFFPIEGIFTRTITVPPPNPAPPFPLLFVETSSPGLRGQSGGPTFDTEGAIWAIQSQTRHLPLGFSPEIKDAGRVEKEHQFLNVGMGVHVETVIGFLKEAGIPHTVA
jgi:hypothetical protein